MRKVKLLAGVSVLLLLLCSCATTIVSTTSNTIPEWVFGRYDTGVSSKYLLAVGSGKSLEAAEKDARQNLASYFGANINSQTYSGSTYYEKGGEVQTSQIYNTDLLVDVKVDDLVGIEDVESFVDSEGTFYVLIGMNKRDSITYYSSKLGDLNKEMVFEFEMLEGSPHNLENLISLSNLGEKVSEATEISEMIGLIDRTRFVSVSVPTAQFERLRQEYIKDITFSFELNGDAGFVAASVEKVVTDNGFHISSDRTANVIAVSLSLYNITGNSKNAFCGFDLAIEIKDAINGKTLSSWEKQGREAMGTYEQAQAKVVYNLSKEIEQEFNEAFLSSF